MAADLQPLKDILKKIEQADLEILAEALVPALLALGESELPDAARAYVHPLLQLVQPELQSLMKSLVDKVKI